MNRRDFLSFKVVREPEPTYDLECHALYLRYLDASRGEASPGAGHAGAHFDSSHQESAHVPGIDELMDELERCLAQVRRVRVLDGEWLQTTGLGARVTPLLDAFRARGGTIVFDSTAAY